MIVLYHHENRIVSIRNTNEDLSFSEKNPVKALLKAANLFPDELLIWCHFDLKRNLNFTELDKIFHHQKIMASYNTFQNSFLSEAIGYINELPFISVNKKVTYPTWQMSSCVGGIQASVLLALKEKVKVSDNLDYFLHSLAMLSMPKGLFCYSEPKLLIEVTNEIKKKKSNNFILFRFVKQHFKTRWIFLLLLNFLLYERKIPILPFVFSLFYLKRNIKSNLLENIQVESTKKAIELGTIDVVIPTIGRKKYLYDVLSDLSKQTHLPLNVIIVEQNPNVDSTSELDYIANESWPFMIKHIFTHQAGACNARNLALREVKSEWVFLNDDDNRFDSDLIENTFKNIKKYGSLSATTFYPAQNEKLKHTYICQAVNFGSGNSFIKSILLDKVSFNKSLEFGYGEDTEFGLQLRNIGCDIIYFPNLIINHLKAPIGGFRTKPFLLWQSEKIQPKPSPTIMFLKLNNLSEQQIMGYKTILFFKYYRVQKVKNPIKYFILFEKKWNSSVFWANQLKK
jgi:glycosyltransferase involved in cell wall biosynthesis